MKQKHRKTNLHPTQAWNNPPPPPSPEEKHRKTSQTPNTPEYNPKPLNPEPPSVKIQVTQLPIPQIHMVYFTPETYIIYE